MMINQEHTDKVQHTATQQTLINLVKIQITVKQLRNNQYHHKSCSECLDEMYAKVQRVFSLEGNHTGLIKRVGEKRSQCKTLSTIHQFIKQINLKFQGQVIVRLRNHEGSINLHLLSHDLVSILLSLHEESIICEISNDLLVKGLILIRIQAIITIPVKRTK